MSAEPVTINTEWLSDCSGCHIAIVDLHEKILAVLESVRIQRCPVLTDVKDYPPAKIGLVSGAIRSEHDREAAIEMRKSCDLIIAWGSCAVFGGPAGAGGSVIALSYLGGVRVAANYKLMGVAKAALEAYVRELAVDLGPQHIRVNAISAGPIRTLAASGIPDMERLLDWNRQVSPLRANVTQGDVAQCTAFLASDGARMITGQTIYVDGGYSIVGVPDTARKH